MKHTTNTSGKEDRFLTPSIPVLIYNHMLWEGVLDSGLLFTVSCPNLLIFDEHI